ncbi:MAG: class I SAM-dependent methyltransferase [Acaryochloridaceae cyanobacterium RL_2_7]|nr:class I SAM-dependent methyltransferase [Acaryochloridaceae cyanobacterium RL_2_7]
MGNFQFEQNFALPKGTIPRLHANLRAIELLKGLESEERLATSEEQQKLAQYVGWGGLSPVFKASPGPRWKSSAKRLKEILEPEEYDAAFESVLNAHYTSGTVIQEIYRGLEQLGFSGGRILEPSMGTGNFLGHMPEDIAMRSQVTGVELDSLTGRIAKQLYPEHEIYVQGFQETPLPQDYFDLAISNVPLEIIELQTQNMML